MNNNLHIAALTLYRHTQSFYAKVRHNRMVQITVLSASVIFLAISSLVALINFFGLFVASIIIILLLDKVFGFKINPQQFAYA